MQKLRIDVWSDIACPWCYVGKRHLEQALATFPHREHVEVVWRAFELDPSAPRSDSRAGSISYAERLAAKYGSSVKKAEGMIENMTKTAARDGLDFRFDRVRAGNMFDAHRLLHFAHERGCQDALKERLLRAYMTEGEAVDDAEVLVRLAREVGLQESEARAVLASEDHGAQVRADEQQARELGIQGVPFFVLAGRFGVSGAQPAEALLSAIKQAWTALPSLEKPADGAVCGPDGCS